jgi:PAS domain S-box-containing protein
VTTAAPPSNAARILVVDDELGPRESLRMLLKPTYQIQTADSGRAALAQIPAYRPDIVILDIKMPELDGLEVLRRIKRIDPHIEVVMITAYASLETVKMALTHGAFEYLIKPFSRQDLEDVVRRAYLRRRTELGTRGEVARLVEEMRRLAAKTRELEEAARRETVEESLRVTQLSILREISRTIVNQLDYQAISTEVTGQLHNALGYDVVAIAPASPSVSPADASRVVTCVIRDAEGSLGWLVVDNRASGRPVDPRERELLEMLSEYLAIALRNSRLYGEIADTKRSLEQLIASAGDAIITVRADDGIGGWNPAAERTFHVPAAQALGRPITELLPEAEFAAARKRLVMGAEREAFEITRTLSSGTRPLMLAVTLSGLRNRQGGLDGLIAIVRDITTQREIEDQLHQSEKLTALGQLAGGIAHDFNNLLQAILGYAQLMRQNPTNAELIERSLTVVESAAMDGAETVRRIQQFARLRPDEQFVRVDINQIVQDAVAITRPRWEENIARESRALEMRLDLQAGAFMQGRPAALSEVLTNLILNAMDAMPQGGTLTIATRATAGRDVRVSVADTGVGDAGDGAPAHLRAVLLHQGRGRLRPRPVDGLLDRAAPQRRDRRGQRAGRGHDVHADVPRGPGRRAARAAPAQRGGTSPVPRARGGRQPPGARDPGRDDAAGRPHGDPRGDRAGGAPGVRRRHVRRGGHQHRHGGDERLGAGRTGPRARRADPAAVHHRLGAARGRPGAPGRTRRAALPVQARSPRGSRLRPPGRRHAPLMPRATGRSRGATATPGRPERCRGSEGGVAPFTGEAPDHVAAPRSG